MKKPQAGFTIVELLIVIVVIAILAAISIVAYNGIQQRARDSRRVNDIAQIKKALLSYDATHGGIVRPQVTGYSSPGWSGWDTSTAAQWLIFLRQDYGLMPVDPVNVNPPSGSDPYGSPESRLYRYYCYDAGHVSAYPNSAAAVLAYRAESGMVTSSKFPVSSCLTVVPT